MSINPFDCILCAKTSAVNLFSQICELCIRVLSYFQRKHKTTFFLALFLEEDSTFMPLSNRFSYRVSMYIFILGFYFSFPFSTVYPCRRDLKKNGTNSLIQFK